MFFNLLSSKPVFLIDKVEPFAIWGTVGVVAALLLSWLVVFLVKREKSGAVAKKMLFSFLVYALVLGIFMLSLEIAKKYNPAYLEYNYVNDNIVNYVFLPLLITAILALVSAVALFILAKKKCSAYKTVRYVVGGVLAAAVIVSLVLIAIYYSKNIKGDGYYTGEYGKLNNAMLYILSALLVVVAVAAGFILGKKDKKGFDTRCIALAGVCVALSFALSYIKLFEMPYGGSVTLFSMLPVMLFAYIYGTKKGLIVGLLYGILQAIQDPFIVHPAQFLLDYPIAFAMVGFAGSFTGFKVLNKHPQIKFSISAIIGGALRFLCHVLSGVFAFGAYAADAIDKGEGIFASISASSNTMANFWLYSLAYNAYVFIDIVLVIVAGVLLFSSKGFRKEVDKLNPLGELTDNV